MSTVFVLEMRTYDRSQQQWTPSVVVAATDDRTVASEAASTLNTVEEEGTNGHPERVFMADGPVQVHRTVDHIVVDVAQRVLDGLEQSEGSSAE